jgi:hypothetical protein
VGKNTDEKGMHEVYLGECLAILAPRDRRGGQDTQGAYKKIERVTHGSRLLIMTCYRENEDNEKDWPKEKNNKKQETDDFRLLSPSLLSLFRSMGRPGTLEWRSDDEKLGLTYLEDRGDVMELQYKEQTWFRWKTRFARDLWEGVLSRFDHEKGQVMPNSPWEKLKERVQELGGTIARAEEPSARNLLTQALA